MNTTCSNIIRGEFSLIFLCCLNRDVANCTYSLLNNEHCLWYEVPNRFFDISLLSRQYATEKNTLVTSNADHLHVIRYGKRCVLHSDSDDLASVISVSCMRIILFVSITLNVLDRSVFSALFFLLKYPCTWIYIFNLKNKKDKDEVTCKNVLW